MTARATGPRNSSGATFLAVYDGRRCLGHILPRGKSGFEAFDRDEKSLGIFNSQKAAAAALKVLP